MNSSSPAIALIRDAPAFWFGIHVAGVDDPEWGGASVLTSAPVTGIKRGHILTLKACVLDPDHEPGNQTPIFSASRGLIDGITHRSGSSVDQHCYISSIAVATSTSLDSFTLELRNSEGEFLTRRTILISDQSPIIEMSIIDSSGDAVENVLAGGDENLEIRVLDPDDSVDSVYGDVTIKWPGQSAYTFPLNFEAGVAILPLFTSEIIESGDLEIDVTITGANGASNSSHFETPILLSPPEIISIGLCQNGIEIEELMFGQTADAAVRVRSSRPLSEVIVNLEQIGWTVVAPSQSETTCGIDVAGQSDSFFFRIQLDSSFVPGEGSLGVRVVDIDEIASVSYLHFEFMHSPPTIEVNHPLNASHESLLEILVEMEDADGIDATCGIQYSQNNTEVYSRPDSDVNDFDGTGIWSTSWLIPNDIIGNLSIDVSCIDWSGNMVNYSSIIFVEQTEECEEDCDKVSTDTKDETKASTTLMLGAVLLLAVIVISVTLRVRTRGNDGEEGEAWHLDESEPERDERIPEGWSLEEFLQWLDGDMPDDWEEEQWELYRTSLEDLR